MIGHGSGGVRDAQPFDLLVASVRDYAIFLLDPSGHVATWNAGAQLIKGYFPEEIIGKHISTFYTPEDPSGRVASWNPGAEHIKGYRQDEILGQPLSRFFTPEDVAQGKPERELEIALREGRFAEEGAGACFSVRLPLNPPVRASS